MEEKNYTVKIGEKKMGEISIKGDEILVSKIEDCCKMMQEKCGCNCSCN